MAASTLTPCQRLADLLPSTLSSPATAGYLKGATELTRAPFYPLSANLPVFLAKVSASAFGLLTGAISFVMKHLVCIGACYVDTILT